MGFSLLLIPTFNFTIFGIFLEECAWIRLGKSYLYARIYRYCANEFTSTDDEVTLCVLLSKKLLMLT